MRAAVSIEDRIAARHTGLSSKLKEVADCVAGNPVDMAARSLCSASNSSDVSSAVFSRLARVSGFDGDREIRGLPHTAPRRAVSSSARASGPQIDPERGKTIFQGGTGIRVNDIAAPEKPIDRTRLDAAAASPQGGGHVLSFGTSGTPPIVTDGHGRPASADVAAGFVIRSDSPRFLASYVAALGLMKIIVSSPMSRSEADAGERTRKVERTNSGLEEFWAPDDHCHQSKGKA